VSESSAEGAGPAQQLIERARGLRPLLEEHAAESEGRRQVAEPVVRALRDAGVFELMVPKRYGGLELDLDTFLEVGLALGEGDASSAWVTTFLIEHNWMFCQFPEALQEELYRGRSHVLAPGMIAPTGQAVLEKGGHRLSGRWQWATGVMHSDWVIAGALATGGTPDPDLRFFALPIEEVKVEDTWHVDGMCATGSNDVVIDGVFVPAERSVSIGEMSTGKAPGSKLHAGALYHTPMIPILTQAASMPLLGTAKACVRRFRERSKERVLMSSQTRQADEIPAQSLVARSELEIKQAELLMRSVVAEVMELRDAASLEKRAEWCAAYALIVQQSLRIVQELASASGASAHRLDNPLQRAVRDIGTGSCHVIFDLNAHLRNFGRIKLGLDPSSSIF
jgi:3-hydroxy-9,10-secoandrosta-1,3,5(10)-triene-9,17-dione monooxygenase